MPHLWICISFWFTDVYFWGTGTSFFRHKCLLLRHKHLFLMCLPLRHQCLFLRHEFNHWNKCTLLWALLPLFDVQVSPSEAQVSPSWQPPSDTPLIISYIFPQSHSLWCLHLPLFWHTWHTPPAVVTVSWVPLQRYCWTHKVCHRTNTDTFLALPTRPAASEVQILV